MIRHILKLTWNRKKANFLIMSEIFFSFIVLYAVVTLGIFYRENYIKPLGFTYDNVWSVSIDTRGSNKQQMLTNIRQLFTAVQSLDEVESVAGIEFLPFGFPSKNSIYEINGKALDISGNSGTAELQQTLGIKVSQGRWFNRNDEVSNRKPVLINEQLAKELFGNESPIGKALFNQDENEQLTEIIGVITDFRQDGEFAATKNLAFERQAIQDTTSFIPSNLVIKVRPGTTAQFEETLSKRLQATVKDWTYTIQRANEARQTKLDFYLTPLIVAGLIAAFLIAMVALGLIGIIWQNVTARKGEIGLRRATGASVNDIYKHVLGELLMITALGMSLGIVLVIQFPLLGVISFISTKVHLIALFISVFAILFITVLCGLYPSWLATKVQPTEALHGD